MKTTAILSALFAAISSVSAGSLHPSTSIRKIQSQQTHNINQNARALPKSKRQDVIADAPSKISQASLELRGGAPIKDNTSASLFNFSPLVRATLSISLSMSLHYLAYSLARPATMTLFTSSRLGFGGNRSAYPFAMTFISPMSFLLLLGYGGAIGRWGPLPALKATTVGCASVLLISGLLIAKLDGMVDTNPTAQWITKYVIGTLFVFRESYVQLITSQHWSFLSSVLTPKQSSRWFAPISGLTSVTSAVAAMGVGRLSQMLGLSGVLIVAGLVLGASLILGDVAYGIAERNGFNPADEHFKKKSAAKAANKSEHGLIVKAKDIFTRVPTLWALFCEILACQGLSTLLNVLCVTKVSEVIPDDTDRAGWMGKFFATINILSCVLQFGVLPATSSWVEPSALWKGMPLIMFAATVFLASRTLGTTEPSLNLIALAFLLMKTMEFSVRRMLDEMVYVPLDYESRYLGKEVIGVLGYRFGKSAASLLLSGLTSSFGVIGLKELSYFTTGAAAMWLKTAWGLSKLVPTREEADEAYSKMKKSG